MINFYLDVPVLNQRKSISLLELSFCFYVFCQTCSGNSVLGIFSIALLTGLIIIASIQKKSFTMSPYFVLEFLFICYCIYQYYAGIAVLKSVTLDAITKLALLLLINIVLLNYFFMTKNIERILRLYILGLFLGYIVVLICSKDTLLYGRIGSGASMTLLGIEFTGGVSVRIGYGAGLGAFIATLVYYGKNRYKFYFYFSFFAIILALSGTRKSIFLLAAGLILIPVFKYPEKSIRTLIFISVIGLVLYFAFMNVPVLYQTIGYRLEEAVAYFLTGSTEDTSILTRNRLISLAQEAFNERRYTGWGLDNFRDLFYYGKYYTHNNFWEILVSGGLIGFILFYSKYVYLFVKLLSGIVTDHGENLFYYKSFFVLLVIATIMEYWQVTYSQRTMVLVHIIVLGSIVICRENKLKGVVINA